MNEEKLYDDQDEIDHINSSVYPLGHPENEGYESQKDVNESEGINA